LNRIQWLFSAGIYNVFYVTTKTGDIYSQDFDLIKFNVEKWVSSKDKQFQIWQNPIDISLVYSVVLVLFKL